MSRVSTYLNFVRNTEEAFNFYKSVFGGEFSMPIQRMGSIPSETGGPQLSEADKNLVVHVELKILGKTSRTARVWMISNEFTGSPEAIYWSEFIKANPPIHARCGQYSPAFSL